MKNLQENLAILNIWSRNVTTYTRETTTRAWIYDVRMAQFVLKIEKLSHIMGPRASQDLRSPSPIMAPGIKRNIWVDLFIYKWLSNWLALYIFNNSLSLFKNKFFVCPYHWPRFKGYKTHHRTFCERQEQQPKLGFWVFAHLRANFSNRQTPGGRRWKIDFSLLSSTYSP